MASKFHKKAISRISSEERALMVKSLEILSQIHFILEKKEINQKTLAEMLKISQAAVSKMLIPGGNLEMNTVVKLEILLGETIITTPQKVESEMHDEEYMRIPQNFLDSSTYMKVVYRAAEETFGQISITG